MSAKMITDYGSFDWCETCDNVYARNEWDSDARMCVYCALVNIIEEDK